VITLMLSRWLRLPPRVSAGLHKLKM